MVEADDTLNETIRARVAKVRYEAGMTQAELGEALGWGRHRVAAIESGKATLTFADAVRICCVMGLAPTGLLVGTPEYTALSAVGIAAAGRGLLREAEELDRVARMQGISRPRYRAQGIPDPAPDLASAMAEEGIHPTESTVHADVVPAPASRKSRRP